MTAGWKFAAAVPEVQTSGVGFPVRLARPSAKNAAERSSKCEKTSISGCRANATVRGVERLPGAIQTASTPPAWSSETSVRAQSVLRLGAGDSLIFQFVQNRAVFQLNFLVLLVGVAVGDDSVSGEQRRRGSARDR